MKPKIYIYVKDGTTGLQIYDRRAARSDIVLLLIDEAKRKEYAERAKLMNAADIVFLCLPDAAAIEAVTLVTNPGTRIIDASTAHRTAEGWTYGYPELSKAQREAIRTAKRVANPGCHATGFISTVAPMVRMGIIPAEMPLCAYSLTGYSGGGKKLIAEYEDEARDPRHDSHRIYGTNLQHKHLPEMIKVCGLTHAPVFSPILGDFYNGMATTVMLHRASLPGAPSGEEIRDRLAEYYAGGHFVTVAPFGGDEPVIYADTLANTNRLRITVCASEEHVTVTSLFDNLGKGASGAAVQNMNIMLGLDETIGLE